jgi:transaldolase
VTTNPRLVTAVILEKREYWSSRFNPASLSAGELHKKLYNEVIVEGAAALHPRWVRSDQAEGWMCAQVDPVDVRCTERMSARGLELHQLAPNVMVKVPGSLEGLDTVEQLVAQGASVNITFCFNVSQFQAGIQAIERGMARARSNGVDTSRCHYVMHLHDRPVLLPARINLAGDGAQSGVEPRGTALGRTADLRADTGVGRRLERAGQNPALQHQSRRR